MEAGNVIVFYSYNDNDCRKPFGWKETEVETFATVIEVYGVDDDGYWTCDIMWPDGNLYLQVELHELEFEVIQ